MNKEIAKKMLGAITTTVQGASLTGILRQGGPYLVKLLGKISSAALQDQWIDEETYQLLEVDSIVRANDPNMDEVGICANMLLGAIKAQDGEEWVWGDPPARPPQHKFGS